MPEIRQKMFDTQATEGGRVEYVDAQSLFSSGERRDPRTVKERKQTDYSLAPEAVMPSQVKAIEEYFGLVYGPDTVISPPYDLTKLVKIIENSAILPQCIEAYAINIGGYGHETLPKYDENEKTPEGAEDEEKFLDDFWEHCIEEESFQDLRYKLDKNAESVGQGYWEVLRTVMSNDIKGLCPIESYTMRLCGLSEEILIKTPMLDTETNEIKYIERWKRFRKFVQFDGIELRAFKELGDPRHLNRFTGEWSKEPLETGLEANEIFFNPIYSVWTPYGLPRWTPAMPEILSLRNFSELIWLWFNHGCIGTNLIGITNGRIVNRKELEEKIKSLGTGLVNAFQTIFAEFVADDVDVDNPMKESSMQSSVFVKDLSQSINAPLIMQYPPMGRNHVRSIMRVPPIYTGETADYNRATSEAAVLNFENQVLWPIRNRFDERINSVLFPQMGIFYHNFKSKGATTSSMDQIAASTGFFWATQAGSINAAIRMFNELTKFDLPTYDQPWGDMPILLLQQAMGGQNPAAPGQGEAKPPAEGMAPSIKKMDRKSLSDHLNRIASETRAKGMWNDQGVMQESVQRWDRWAERVKALYQEYSDTLKESGITAV